MKQSIINTLLTIVLVFFFQCLSAQFISSEKIKEDVMKFLTDTTSSDYLVKLKSNFEKDESTLTEMQYYLLYYGQGAKPDKLYPNLGLNPERMKLDILITKKKYKKAILLGENLIKINPIDITTIIDLATSIVMMNGDKNNIYYKRMKNFVTAILETGDGKTPETAIKIADVEDDEAIIGFTGFQGISKQEKYIGKKHFSVWTNSFGDKFYFEYVLIFM